MKSNESLQLKVANQLRKDPLLKDTEIVVAICDQKVVVTGRVNKFFKKALVNKLVKEVSGIKNITDDVAVRLTNAKLFRDEDITLSIIEKFEKNFGSSYKNIDVGVKEGRVNLTGTLKWHYQKLLATDCISYIDGIVSIQNDISIGALPESILTEKDILAAIYKEDLVTSDVNVDLNGKKVILTGEVSSAFQKKIIEKIVSELPGIHEMESRLTIEKKLHS